MPHSVSLATVLASFTLVLATAAFAGQPKPPPVNGKPADDAAKTLPTDQAANAAIDAGFRRWSTVWMFDRYMPGSARATDRALKDGTYVVRGVFDFARFGAKLTIPF